MGLKLVLFDIDGTIVTGNGMGTRALIEAIESQLQITIDQPVQMAGKTDLQIIYDIATTVLPESEITPNIPAIKLDYLERLQSYFTKENGVRLLPLIQTIERLARESTCLLGLLTGNLQQGARIKMGEFGINSFFQLGAFGDDTRKRSDLPQKAVNSAYELTGQYYTGKAITIIGDTGNDVRCGKHLDVKSIGICCTPPFRKEILEANPDYYFEKDDPPEEIVRAVLAD